MSQEITRMYGSLEDAENAVAALAEDGFNEVHLVAGTKPTKKANGRTPEDIASDIMKGMVLKEHAVVYAEGVARGGSLVTAHAPFGSARKVMAIMDEFGPIESGVREEEDNLPIWDEATPISCALAMPVLMDDGAVFSRFLGMPVLTSPHFSVSEKLGLPIVSRDTPKTSSFGFPLLSNSAAPLSSMLGLPTLTKSKG
jgi:hypothetical protein